MADVRSGAEALPQVPRVAMSAEAIATDINRQGTAIGNTQVAQNRSLPPEEWTGAAADAASTEIQKLGEKTVSLSEAFSPAATALNEWGSAVNSAISDVTGLQNDWDKAVHDYNKAIEEADAAVVRTRTWTRMGYCVREVLTAMKPIIMQQGYLQRRKTISVHAMWND